MRWALLCAVVAGCDPAATQLFIDLKTDLEPVREFDTVSVRVLDVDTEVPADAAIDYLSGARVATFVQRGDEVDVEVALSLAGERVAAQRARAPLFPGRQGVTVLIQRGCRGVVCPPDGEPDALACRNGECVAPTCTEETPERCPIGECVADLDCPTDDDCAIPRCLTGACFYGTDRPCAARRPTAVIEGPADLECGRTSVPLDASSSRVGGGGSPLVHFAWTVERVGVGSVDRFAGLPADEAVGERVRGGTNEAPRVGLTPYDGARAWAAFLADLDPSLVYQVLQGGVPITAGRRYRLRFAARAERGGAVRARVSNHDVVGEGFRPYGPLTDVVELDEDWTVVEAEFDAIAGGPNGRLAIFYERPSPAYHVDDVSLVDLGTGEERIRNGSFEDPLGDPIAEWRMTWDGVQQPSGVVDNPALEPGQYRVTLVVTDEAGVASLPATIELHHARCGA